MSVLLDWCLVDGVVDHDTANDFAVFEVAFVQNVVIVVQVEVFLQLECPVVLLLELL